MKYSNIREEELKNKVGQDFFAGFDTSEIPGNIDFCVKSKQVNLFDDTAPLLRAEAKTGNYDVAEMFTQLIITIGKARTFDKTLPPAFLGAFDFKKIAFVEYIEIQDIFYENDFNRNVTPSNHDTKEFKKVKKRIEGILKEKTRIYDYKENEDKLRNFIKNTIGKAKSNAKIKINKNNFKPIYLRWLDIVKPQIDVNWDELKKKNIVDSDFFLADLFIEDHGTDTITDDETIKKDLFVTYEDEGYKISRDNLKDAGFEDIGFDAIIRIKNKKQYEFFWKNYKRPPKKEYQKYIIERRDLIVPSGVRERKGAFFTPRIWVEKSQEYMANYFGENYQDEYYIRDCAAGTGNLLVGLINPRNIYASTLEVADVKVMKDMVKTNSLNLLENHVFQFDFLNDKFSKLPQGLQEIINDEEKRKKLIIYINPPYAESGDKKQIANLGKNKDAVQNSKIYDKYQKSYGTATRELFAQFYIRIYEEIGNCNIASFSTLKLLNSQNFIKFRNIFKARLIKGFMVPANTFDNVKGDFPISFLIWNLNFKEQFERTILDMYSAEGDKIGTKNLYSNNSQKFLVEWLRQYYDKTNERISYLRVNGPDVQNNLGIFLSQKLSDNDIKKHFYMTITRNNIIPMSIYYATRTCIEGTWHNDRDQFLRPKDERENDIEFQNDCLAFTLFHGQNRITSRETGVNHRIPFTETEVKAKDTFKSNFMSEYIKCRKFSLEAKDIFDAGRKLRTYYHENCNEDYLVNASLYEIREYFQGRNDKGKMNNKSTDEKYNELIGNLREKLKILGDKIAEKVYEYEFLKR